MASKIPENFFKKVQYLIIVPLRNILTVKIQEQDVDKILGKIFSTKVGNKSVEELLKEVVEKNAMIALQKSEVIDDIKNNAVNLLIAANLASQSIKRDVFGSRFGMALKTQK